MRQVNLKKYVLPNLPYLFVGLYATKLGQAFYAVGIKDKGIGIALKMEDGASSIVPYAILSVLTQLGVITPEEACSLPRYHDKNLYNNHHAVVGRTELAFQLEQLC